MLLAMACMLLWCAIPPSVCLKWWGAVFQPLCQNLLTDGKSGEVVLKSRLWELLQAV